MALARLIAALLLLLAPSVGAEEKQPLFADLIAGDTEQIATKKLMKICADYWKEEAKRLCTSSYVAANFRLGGVSFEVEPRWFNFEKQSRLLGVTLRWEAQGWEKDMEPEVAKALTAALAERYGEPSRSPLVDRALRGAVVGVPRDYEVISEWNLPDRIVLVLWKYNHVIASVEDKELSTRAEERRRKLQEDENAESKDLF